MNECKKAEEQHVDQEPQVADLWLPRSKMKQFFPRITSQRFTFQFL